jgi:hypothetical protein
MGGNNGTVSWGIMGSGGGGGMPRGMIGMMGRLGIPGIVPPPSRCINASRLLESKLTPLLPSSSSSFQFPFHKNKTNVDVRTCGHNTNNEKHEKHEQRTRDIDFK